MIKIIFNDNTDYIVAEEQVKIMFSEVMASKCKCECKDATELRAGALITAIDIDRAYNSERWKADIRALYKMLKASCDC